MVVKQVFRRRVVDGNDRHTQRPVRGHRLEAEDTGGRLFGRANDLYVTTIGMQHSCEIGAIIHRDGRRVVEYGIDVLVVGVVVLAANREHRDPLGDKSRSDVILG